MSKARDLAKVLSDLPVLNLKNSTSGNGVATLTLDRVNNTSYENSLTYSTNGVKQWFYGLDNDSTDDLLLYNWTSGGSVYKVSSDGLIKGQQSDKAFTFVKLNAHKYWSASNTSRITGSISTTSSFGLPSGVKAVYVSHYSFVGNTDHYNDIYGPVSPSGANSWSFNTSNTAWGSLMAMHDGDSSGYVNYYGCWTHGIIGVSSDTIYYVLSDGISAGTHYHNLYVWGYWI